MTLVKICGITHVADAEVALAAGADMLGFICYAKSPRYLTLHEIIAILSELRPLPPDRRTVGVFVNESVDSVRSILAWTGLDLAQLHGDESPALLQQLDNRAFKALRCTDQAAAAIGADRFGHLGPPAGPDLLLDAYHPHAYGGTGQRADWRIAAAIARKHRLLLAGGLTPDNVAEAITQVQPWGVDVSSGVEREPGRKDHEAVRAFIAAAKQLSP